MIQKYSNSLIQNFLILVAKRDPKPTTPVIDSTYA